MSFLTASMNPVSSPLCQCIWKHAFGRTHCNSSFSFQDMNSNPDFVNPVHQQSNPKIQSKSRIIHHMGQYMGLDWSSWTGLGRLRKLSVRLLDQFRMFRVQKWYYDEIYRWFCMVLLEKFKHHIILTTNLKIFQTSWKIPKNEGFPRGS